MIKNSEANGFAVFCGDAGDAGMRGTRFFAKKLCKKAFGTFFVRIMYLIEMTEKRRLTALCFFIIKTYFIKNSLA